MDELADGTLRLLSRVLGLEVREEAAGLRFYDPATESYLLSSEEEQEQRLLAQRELHRKPRPGGRPKPGSMTSPSHVAGRKRASPSLRRCSASRARTAPPTDNQPEEPHSASCTPPTGSSASLTHCDRGRRRWSPDGRRTTRRINVLT